MTLFPIEPPAPGGEPRRVSLVRLSAEIHRGLAAIGRIAVEGEVHRPSTRPGGRVYFVLKDRAAQITVTVPGSRARRARAIGGERVRVTGTLDWFAGGGSVQLVADEVVPVGEGAVAAMIAEARARLAADGLLARPRRRIPRLPAAIGVVCGSDAAVRHDIESVVQARFPGYPLVIREVTVSGPGAADAVAGALADLDGASEVEVIVVARGGGDATQLLPFSDEDLCRAICRSATPVVSAIGHEQDRPLCDEVADLRCGTPSLAAAAVVPDREALTGDLDVLGRRAGDLARRAAERAAHRLGAVDRDRAVAEGLTRARERLTRAGARLELVHPARRLPVVRAALDAAARQMDALSPARVLERGYAVVRTAGGAVVREAARLAPGDVVTVTVARGSFGAVVDGGQAREHR